MKGSNSWRFEAFLPRRHSPVGFWRNDCMNKTVRNTKPLHKRKRLGEILIESGLIDERTLSKALDIRKIKKEAGSDPY